MKKVTPVFILFFTFLVAFTVPVARAADGCGSAGPTCTVNGNSGVCAQSPDTGDFYCRPTVLNQSSSGGSTGFVALAPIFGLTDASSLSVAKSTNLASFFNNLYKYLIGLAAALAVIMIIWGGLEYSTQDVPSAKQNGKDRILQAILGLVLVLSPVLVFSIINPSILNLSINLKPLDTRSGAPTQTGINPEVPSPGPNRTIIFREGWRASSVPGTYCFTTPPNSGGSYYCASDNTKCTIAYNGMCPVGGGGCSAVTSPCTSY